MMLTTDKVGVKSALPRSVTPLLPRAGCRARARRVSTNAFKQVEGQETTRRDLLAALGLLGSFTTIQSVQAATDPYEELRSITSSRSGSTSLMESFNKTRDAVTTAAGKTNRGIRERLAAEASNAPKPSTSSSSGGFRFSTPASPAKPSAPVAPKASSGSGFSLFGSRSGPKPQAPKPQAPKPQAPKAASGSGFSLFGSSSGPKPQPPKPQAPKLQAPKLQPPKPAAAAAAAPKAAAAAAAAAAGGSGGGSVLGPAIQAAGVLGLVGVGANAVTSFATSNKKGGAKSLSAVAAPTGTRKVQPTQLGTARISANKPAAATRSATGKVAAGAAAAANRTQRIVKKAPGAAADATGTVKAFVQQALVNSEQPDEPTDFAVAGILGFTAVVGAFFIFGLPQPTVIEPEQSSRANDPLVVSAKEGAFSAGSRSSYKNPLFKSFKAE